MAIKLHDKFKVLRDVRDASPSMQEMRLDERSRCRRWPPEVRASILEMRLQCRLRDVTVELRGTSNKLRQQGKSTGNGKTPRTGYRTALYGILRDVWQVLDVVY